MAKLPSAIYLLNVDEPSGILPWGKSPEQAKSDLEAMVARIGGFRSPNYSQAYLLSANTLLRTALQTGTLDHNGLAIFYLQRHAAELMLKAPLRLGIEIQNYRKQLRQPHPKFPDEEQAKRAEGSHELKPLLADLEAMVLDLRVGIVPDVLRLAIKEILEVEKQGPTWSRYPHHWEGKRNAKTLHLHQEQEIVIPLGKIQDLLQKANDALGAIWPANGLIMGGLGSLYERLLRDAGEIG